MSYPPGGRKIVWEQTREPGWIKMELTLWGSLLTSNFVWSIWCLDSVRSLTMHVLFNATTFCVELCTFKIRELLMLLTYERRFTRTCFLQDGDSCRGFWTSRLPVFASPCSEVTALGHKLKLVKLLKIKKTLGVESQTHCAMVYWLAATATERSLIDSC